MCKLSIAVIGLVLMTFGLSASATDCPHKIRVQAKDFSSVSADDEKAVTKFFELGHKQTDKEYIQAVLKVANDLEPVDEEVTFSKKASGHSLNCIYTGKSLSLSLAPVGYGTKKGYVATLKLGKIKYRNDNGNPSAHNGNALDLVTPLKQVEATSIEKYKNRVNVLSFELDVQVPLDDYGTDGFTETATVGRAESVKYTVVE